MNAWSVEEPRVLSLREASQSRLSSVVINTLMRTSIQQLNPPDQSLASEILKEEWVSDQCRLTSWAVMEPEPGAHFINPPTLPTLQVPYCSQRFVFFSYTFTRHQASWPSLCFSQHQTFRISASPLIWLPITGFPNLSNVLFRILVSRSINLHKPIHSISSLLFPLFPAITEPWL